MKIAVLALCVVLPSICLCTPLPDVSAVAGSQSGAGVQTNGNGPVNANVNSSSNSNVTVGTPPAVPPTVPATTPDSTTPPATPPTSTPDTTQPPCTGDNTPAPTPTPTGVSVDASSKSDASVTQQGGNGGVSVDASSSSSASVTVSGNKCGKPDVQGFDKYSVLVKSQGDVQKFTSANWMVWKSSSSTTKIEGQDCVCAPRYLDSNCKASQYKITVQSETDILYEVWGYNGAKILYIKQKLSITSQQYQIYTSQVVSIAEATTGSQEVIAVQNEQVIRQYFDNGVFAVLDTDYETYMICTTSGENSVTFVSLSQQVYESVELRQQVSQKVDQVLKVNNLSSVQFIEVSNKFDVDISQYKWDQCSQGGSGNNGQGSGTNINANADSSSNVNVNQQGSPNGGKTDIKAGADSKSDVSVNQQGSPNGDKTDIKAGADSKSDVSVNQQGSPNGDKTDIKAGADSKSDVSVNQQGSPNGDKTDIKAGADSKSDVSVNQQGSPNGGKTDVKAGADSSANVNVNQDNNGGSCSGSSGKPTQQGFTNYSVLKISSQEFQSKIDKITWFVARYSQSQEEVKSDVTVCADRYVCQSCKAAKFQYVTEDGCFIMKEWGCDDANLIYIQEKISFVTQDFVILKAEVVNVMKATKDSDVAVKNENSEQVKSYLSSEYAVLGTDYKNFFIGQTSCDKGSVTFVAFIQEIYECEEKQQQFSQQISQILKESGIDESKLQKLTQKFIADTNKYNKVKSETVSKDGSTTTKQETEHEGSGGKTKTETTVSNGPSPPPSSGSSVDANASSKSNVSVDTTQGPSGTPSGSTTVDANSSSDANVNVNTGGTPPCTGTPPPSSTPPPATPSPATPPATPPPSAVPPTSVSANSSSDANASVNGATGPTTVGANSSSDAAVAVNGSP